MSRTGPAVNNTVHPSVPRLALRVGVSGHRELDEADARRVRMDLDAVISVLDRTVDELAVRYAAYFSAEPPLKRLISALAEGADTLAAEVAGLIQLVDWSIHRSTT